MTFQVVSKGHSRQGAVAQKSSGVSGRTRHVYRLARLAQQNKSRKLGFVPGMSLVEKSCTEY